MVEYGTAGRRHTASIQRRCNLSERPGVRLLRLADDGSKFCDAESTEATGKDRDGRKDHKNCANGERPKRVLWFCGSGKVRYSYQIRRTNMGNSHSQIL
jgi:hypothetical protein